MSSEYHISSFVVQCRPEVMERLRQDLSTFAGVDIHQTDSSGKIIITLESLTTGEIAETTNAINALTGVLSCNMVFHQIESSSTEAAINEF